MRTLISLTLAAMLAVAVPAARADITASGLLSLWQEQAAAEGRSIAVAETQETPDGLVLNGLTLRQDVGETTFEAEIATVTLTETGGAVTVSLPAGQPIVVTTEGPDADPTVARLDVTEGPLTLTASGAAEAPDYAVAAENFALALADLTGPEAVTDAAWTAAIAGLTGTLSPGDAAGALITADLQLARFASDLSATDGDTGESVVTSVAQSALTLALALTPGAAEEDDWAFDLRTSSGPSTTLSRQAGPETGVVETESRQASTQLSMSLSDGRGNYATSATGMDLVVRAERSPVGAVELSAAAADLALSIPTAAGPDEQTARVQADIQGLTAGETVWSFFDPSGGLPRTPATVVLDVEGDVVLSDEPVAGMPMAEGMPGLLPRALRINTLSVDFAEAELDAEGAFTVETGASGVPDLSSPVGTLYVAARGVMTLLERLTAGGVMTPDQAMGAQMMLGMFAQQAPDGSLTSEIEARPGGELIVNGTRVR